MAIFPPFAIQVSTTISKFFQILMNIRRCPIIFRRVAGPHFFRFMCCHGDPPVQGIAAHSNVLEPMVSTDDLALFKPFGVVTSSSIVNLMTSVSGGDF